MSSSHYPQTCGCEANIHLDTNGIETGSITYCSEHAAAPEMSQALTKMLETWYFQKTEQFDLARKQAQTALKLSKGIEIKRSKHEQLYPRNQG